jgi:uncharacterized lipoprotein YddW (UPF0748 family)
MRYCMNWLASGWLFWWSISGLCAQNQVVKLPAGAAVPPPKREFRAVWIASVANIDWPSQKGLSTLRQQREFVQLLDQHQLSGLNAVVVQVRPATDAFYYSAKEPWSEWLTGTQGAMPDPYYDPLQFMVDEAHQRGLEFHAWLNPYRAMFDADSGQVAADHLTNLKPEWFIKYGKNKVFNPGLPEVRQYITDVVTDVVRRYDVDAIHFDDYFYPYPIKDVPFDDQATFAQHGTGFASLADWRRDNVNRLIEQLAAGIKRVKPHVKFGISPFGLWRNQRDDPAGSATQGGQTCYDHLFADVRLWVQRGWIDYVAPQVYFSNGFEKIPYQALVEWWSRNHFGKHLYIGQASYKINPQGTDPHWANLGQLPSQLRYNRQLPGVSGSIYFSSKSLTRNLGGFRDSLRRDFYLYPALVPPMPWKGGQAPAAPRQLEVFAGRSGVLLNWEPPAKATGTGPAAYYAVYRFAEGEPVDVNDPTHLVGVWRGRGTTFTDAQVPATGQYTYVVTALDRLHLESPPSAPASLYYHVPGSWIDFTQVLVRLYRRAKKPKPN